MAAKGQSITVTYYAYNTNTNAYQTGDAANHTLKLLKDGTEAAPTNSNAEVDSTNTPGLYSLALTSAECTFNTVDIAGKSATANVVLIGKTYLFDNVPVFAIGTQGGLLTIGSGAGQINVTSGFANANVQQWEGLPPSALQNGLVQSSMLSGMATSVGNAAIGNVAGNVLGTTAAIVSGVNITQWLAVTPASTVGGGFLQVAVVSGAVTGVTTTVNANVTQAGGTNVTAASGFLQVNVTQISGIGPQINANGILQSDVEQWRGSQPATLSGTFVQADAEQWKGVAVNSLISGRVDVNVGQMQANSIQTSTYNASALTTTVFATNFLTSALVDATQNNAAADALLDRSNAVETGLTPRQAWRLDAAAAGGVTSGALSPGFQILGAGVSTKRVSAVTDASGNRLSVTLTL